MSVALKTEFLPNYTYEDFCLWEGRWEIIAGVPYAMSPAPSSKHQWLCSVLNWAFFEELKNCKKCRVCQPVDWKIDEHTVLEPDLFIACFDFTDSTYITKAPTLIVEVLSPSTRNKDTTAKKEIYERQGVKYYVIIDPEDDSYIINELSVSEYRVAQSGHDGSFIFEIDGCHAEINFGQLFSK